MTAIKSRIAFRTILDFSNENVTKSLVRRELRETNVPEAELNDQTITYINNQIQVGMYTILLVFPDSSQSIEEGNLRSRLREYGDFLIRISENSPVMDQGKKYDFLQEIDITRDRRFRTQRWSHYSTFNMTDLTEVIMYCHRLDSVKAFL